MDFTGAARRRSPQSFANAAKLLRCELAAVQAVVDVETNGSGFDAKGRPKALFEPHVMWRNTSGKVRDRAAKAGLAYPKWRRGNYPKDSYPRIEAAMSIDETAALRATSWGLPQILGENHELAGYDTPQEMVAAFTESEDVQIEAMARFIKAAKLDGHLRSKNWKAFAVGYNGPAAEENGYPPKLRKTYEKRAAIANARKVSIEEIDDERVQQPATWNDPVDDEHEKIIEHDPSQDREVAATVQQRLRDLGYFEVGAVDGDLADRTKDSILAFRRANGLPLSTEIDDELLVALAKAKPRAIAPSRSEATAKDLREANSETLSWVDRIKKWAGAIFGVGIFGSAADGGGDIADALDSGTSIVGSVKSFMGVLGLTLPTLLLLAAAGLGIWFIAHRIEQRRVDEYRAGKNT